MGLISDILKGRNKNNNGTHDGINMTSGNSNDFITPFSVAIGMLLTGRGDVKEPKDLKSKAAEGKPETKNKGILGLLSKISENTDIIVGKQNKEIFSKYLRTSKKNAEYLNKNVLNNKFVNSVKKIPEKLDIVNKSLTTIADKLKNNGEGAHGGNASIEVKGGSEIAAIFEAVKNFTYDEKNQTALDQLVKDTSKGGRIEQLFVNINELNAMEIDVKKFKNNLDKINEAINSTSRAVGSDKASTSTKNALNNLEGMKDLILGVIGIGLLFIVVGLLAKKIDFAGLAMFAGILLVFVIAITGVFILASKLVKPGSGVIEGMESFMNVVYVAAVILIIGGLVMNFIDVSSLFKFAATLTIFLAMIIAPFIMFERLSSKHDMGETYNSISTMIIVASTVMILGSLIIGFINIGNLFKFTITLSIFLFAILGVFTLVTHLFKVDGIDGMEDALALVVGSAFIMFLGAAVMPALNIKNLALFTFTLGMFLFVTLGVLALVSKWFKAGGKKGMKDALFLIVGASFIMFLGAAVMPHVDYGMLLLFTATLSVFLFAVMTPFLLLRPVIEHVKQAAIGVVLVVGISAVVLMIGGGLFLKYPGLMWAVPVFGAMLWAFVSGIMWTYKKAAVGVEKAIPTAGALSILVGISAFALLSGGMLFINYPELPGAVVEFGIILGIFVAAMTAIVWALSKIKNTNLKKATLAMLGISGVLVIVSGVFMILAEVEKTVNSIGGWGTFTLLVLGAMGVLAILTAGILWLAKTLGKGVTTAMAYLAIGVVIAAAAAFAIVAAALVGIAASLKILSTIKSFDMTPLIKGVVSLIGLTIALAPLAQASPIILTASIALTALTMVISKMAQAVKEYADLKISVYEGTKHVGYRSLTTRDFESAANNVALIITTLTTGIMQAYNQHPEWYGATDLETLFQNSLNGGQTPLERVIRQSKLLAPLISEIAEAVKEYADLKIKTYDGTKHVGYRHLDRSDFDNAAQNVSLVITTLTQGVMNAYEEHPEWYGTGGNSPLDFLKSVFTNAFNDGTPLERVIKHSMRLGPLISKIGEAIEEIANLKFATKWDNQGKAVAYKQMKSSDFSKASDNIVQVITTMSEGIMKVYEQHPDWYGTGGNSVSDFVKSVFTNAFNDGTPMERVIAHDLKLSKLISKIADSIKDYAELKVPIKWNEQGNVIAYRSIKGEDFTNAGDNIVKVMTTLSYGLMTVYQEHPEWYENTGFFGSGDTPMEKVISTDTKLSKLISNVAASVKDYAELLIPIDWDKQSGKAIKFRAMKPEDFTAAGENIGLVVTSAALGLMGYHSDGTATPYKATIEKYLMKDANDDQEEFERLLENSQKIGTIISGMADGISKYAKMLVPDEWDPKTGTPIHYVRMDSTMMKDAGDGIGNIIKGVAYALITAYNKNKAMFGWNENEQKFDSDSPIQHVIDSCVNVGKVISGVADGITKFAEMKMPIAWDDTGKPIKFQKIDENVFTDAGTHINDILTAIGNTMKTVYNNNQEMFTIPTKKEGGFLGIGESEVPVEKMTPFEKVTAASVQMAQVIGSIAQALQTFADKKAIGKDRNGNDIIVSITDSTLTLAKTSITKTLTTVAATFNKLATGKDSKIFTSKSMNTIVDAVGNMMSVVGTMSTSLQNLVMLKIPIKWNENGEATAYRQMGKGDFELASTNIQKILCAVGDAFTTIVNDPRNSWIINANQNKEQAKKTVGKKFVENTKSSAESINGVGAILDDMSTLATILSVISGCIYGYATMRFPIGTDKDGNVQYSNPITDTQMKAAKTHINTVATTLVDAMKMIIENKEVAYLISENGSKALKSTSTAFNTIISSITSIIEGANDLSENEAAKSISKVSDRLKNMIAPLTSIINNIGSILMLLFKGDEKYGEHNVYNFMTVGKEMTVQYSFAELMKAYQPMFDATKTNFSSFIKSIIDIVESLSNMDKPLNESYMKINSLHRLFETEHYVDKIRSIIDNIKNMLTNTRKISSFDDVFVDKETGLAGFAEGVVNFFSGNESREAANHEKAQKEIDHIKDRLSTYSDLILTVTDTLKKIYTNVSDTRMANYAGFNNSIVGFFHAVSIVKRELSDVTKDQSTNITGLILSYSSALNSLIDTSAKTSSLVNANFDILTNGIISVNESISNINENGLSMFKSQSNQLEKFVNTVNSVKLLNISRLNKFVTSLNQLANKMGNLDRLTEAISNKLSKVLEKLVERLTHAEQTIVKADEIQKRRHELIKKSVKEVSALMKQPMTIEVQAMNSNSGNNGGEQTPPQNTPPQK